MWNHVALQDLTPALGVALWERGVPVEYQVYPMARRAFDFRQDQTPEEKIAARHARERAKGWLVKWMGLTPEMGCK